MSTSDKLTYLNGTKQALKESINNLGGEITNETTFREYAQELDNIYDNLPKTTGEGTSISLSPTLKGKLDFEDGIVGYGDTKQNSYEGYNELNIYAVHPIGYSETVSGVTIKYNNDGSVTATGTATADVNYFLGSRASLGNLFNGTYYLSGCKTGSNTTYYLSMWVEGIGVYPQTTTEVATNKTSGVNWNIVIAVKSGASVNYTFYPMMSKTSGKNFEPYVGGTASPNPSYPQDIEVVTGTQEVTISNSDNTETQTQIVSLGDIELCKIGNYQDYLYKSNDKWYKKEQIKKVVLNGSETWQYDSSNQRYYTPTLIASNVVTPPNNNTKAEALSNIGIITANETIYTSGKNGIAIHPNGSIYITKSVYDNISTTNVIFYYVYLTPQDIQITNETLISQLDNLEKLKSYNGTTNISSSGSLPMILNVSALKGE